MKTKEEILSILKKEIKYLEEKYGVEKIGIFGSYSRQEQDEKSDIDILVQFKKGCKNFDNYMDLKFYLENLFSKKVDLIIESAVKDNLKPYILEEVQYA